MQKRKKILIISLLAIYLMFVVASGISSPIFADTGNNNDYSSSSTSFDSSPNSSSYSDDGDIVQILIWLFLSALPWPVKVVIALVLIFMASKRKNLGTNVKRRANGKYNIKTDETVTRMSKDDSSYGENENRIVANNTENIEMKIKEIDPNFSTDNFLGWAEEVFMLIQQAWTTRNWEKIRPFEKENLYRKHELQLQEYINNGTINVLERINVNQTYLYKYQKDAEYEYLKVYLQARMNDYIIDENTKEVIKGDKDREYHTKYILTFMRKSGVLTDAATSNMSTHKCPHCSAPLSITSAGKCEYCNTIVTTGAHDWVLSDLDSIKKDTQM